MAKAAPYEVSHCCGEKIDRNHFGQPLCSRCWAFTKGRRDLIGWLFPAEPETRPTVEPVFVRYGRKVEVLPPGAVRGRPDGWFWVDA